jgi:hypothetical protein
MIVSIYCRIFFNWYVERDLITKKISLVKIPKCWIKTKEQWEQLENEPLPF